MPADPSIYGQQAPVRINSPFESLGRILQVRNQQEAAAGLREQRQGMAEERRAKAEQTRLEVQAAAGARALFNRVDPVTGQPKPPTVEELAGTIGQDAAVKFFDGVEALKTKTANNQTAQAERLGRIMSSIQHQAKPLRALLYKGALGELVADGTLKPGDAPQEYDENWVNLKMQQALSVADQVKANAPKAPIHVGDSLVQPTADGKYEPVYTAPPKPEKVTFAAPQTMMVNGRRTAVRAGSDGRMYDMNQKPIAGEAIAPEPKDTGSGGGKEQWLLRAGKPVYSAQVQPGDEPLRAQLNTGDTAQDRQREARVAAARDFLTRLNELRTKINTKMGPSAGVTGSARRAGAAMGMDPDVAEYERIRAAGGRAMAVAIMGAANLSDQDANAWSNMFPDARTDEQTAVRLTDQVERMLNGMTGKGAPAPAGAAPAVPGRIRVVGPNGETGTVPDNGAALPAGWKRAG